MRYLSVCSGIEAASVAFEPLGWEPVAFSEIDAFPAAVLKHRFPNVPNWGDMTKFEEWPDVSIDLICGGTPCQSFSIAGLRKGLDDARGNLMLTFGLILAKYRPRWFVWENVPGVLSSDEGRDFASFLGLVTGQAIEPPTDGWRTGGAISGIDSAYGIAYRVIDAQFTRSPNYPRAVPQRRRRVFVVGHLGDWRRAAAVLFDSESVSRNPPPRRETGKRVAGTLKGGSGERGYPDPSDGNGGGLVEIGFTPSSFGGYSEGCGTLRSDGGDLGGGSETLIAAEVSPTVTNGPPFSRTGNEYVESEALVVGWPASVAPTLNAHFGDKQGLEDQHALNGAGLFVPVVGPLTRASNAGGTMTQQDIEAGHVIAVQGTIIGRSDLAGPQGRGTSEDGAMFTLTKTDQHAVAIRTAQTSSNGHGFSDDVAYTIDQAQGQAVAFTCKDSGQDAGEISPTLRSMNFDGSHANGGGQVAVAFGGDVARALTARHDSSPCADRGMDVVAQNMAVRRLLPVETERLQGFKDGHTNVPYRNKPTSPDGPRYKAIGNSMATPCMEWIGHRIEAVETQ